MHGFSNPIHRGIPGHLQNGVTLPSISNAPFSVSSSCCVTVSTISACRSEANAVDMRDPIINIFGRNRKVKQNNREDLTSFLEYPDLFSDDSSIDSDSEVIFFTDSVSNVLP